MHNGSDRATVTDRACSQQNRGGVVGLEATGSLAIGEVWRLAAGWDPERPERALQDPEPDERSQYLDMAWARW